MRMCMIFAPLFFSRTQATFHSRLLTFIPRQGGKPLPLVWGVTDGNTLAWRYTDTTLLSLHGSWLSCLQTVSRRSRPILTSQQAIHFSQPVPAETPDPFNCSAMDFLSNIACSIICTALFLATTEKLCLLQRLSATIQHSDSLCFCSFLQGSFWIRYPAKSHLHL